MAVCVERGNGPARHSRAPPMLHAPDHSDHLLHLQDGRYFV